ncbi:hypothetical protein ABPG72_017309 [Tetrahymena utriculariae]
MIFVLRHAERADNSPYQDDQKDVKLEFDPHLTDLGVLQSQFCAQSVKKILETHNPNVKRVVYVSSPFLRCIQTVQYVHLYLGLNAIEDKLYVQTHIGEMLRSSWFEEDINKKLIQKTDQNLSKQIGLKIEEPFVQDDRLIQQVYPENKLGDFYDRFKRAYEIIVQKFLNTYNTEETVLIIVTHGFGVQAILDQFNCFSLSDMVDYCSINAFDYRQDSLPNKEYPFIPKICIKQQHDHVQLADNEFSKRKYQNAKF